MRPDGACLIVERVVRALLRGERAHAPAAEHIFAHEPVGHGFGALWRRDACEESLALVRSDGFRVFTVALKAERIASITAHPEVVIEAFFQLVCLALKPLRPPPIACHLG